ncbi:MAG: alanine racemase [Candidatus Liptonbacteria bacterium GWB1_49_6]|uniref:Alanine racemase n=1 Tax=Candidatus Liptonbacteria bacterium GWB1_49_6 TaxID=1798644 RepID=A0A1G2C7E0_9BACT|nr:MAG: alanine racemase [Candidatus Liptonbacteria bacterium GWB1_49_6]
MSAKRSLDESAELAKKTWIEINGRAAKKNCQAFRKVIGPRVNPNQSSLQRAGSNGVKLWAVVKSNAYGHGLLAFSRAVERDVDGFCVDSVIEGIKLRRAGIKKFILVLGPTLPAPLREAGAYGITVSISNFDALKSLAAMKNRPAFHLKIDTGMHRQGFYLEDLPKVERALLRMKEKAAGIFTHFASAKDIHYPTYTEKQYSVFQEAVRALRRASLPEKTFIKHCAATGGVLVGGKYFEDAVRVGMGLYGYFPSPELKIRANAPKKFSLVPVLSWKAAVSEVKKLKPGDYIGYDLSERVSRPTTMAILPIGYWHGMPRSLSGKGKVWISGRLGKILGRVSMDLLVVDVTGIPCRAGDSAMLVGPESGVLADEIGEQAGTTHYEFLTRLNPLIERRVIH